MGFSLFSLVFLCLKKVQVHKLINRFTLEKMNSRRNKRSYIHALEKEFVVVSHCVTLCQNPSVTCKRTNTQIDE